MNSRRKIIRAALMDAIGKIDEATGRPMLELAAETAVRAAVRGDIAALGYITDRIDGRVPHAIVGDDSEPPMQVEVSNRDLASALLLLIEELRAKQIAGMVTEPLELE